MMAVALLVCLATPPPWAWQTASPRSVGLDPAKLDAAWTDLARNSTDALLVIRHDALVYERYGPQMSRNTPHGTASMAKALVGGFSLALCMADGLVQRDDLACKWVPQWRDDPLKRKITLAQLVTHTSGLDDAEQDDIPHEKLPGWKGAFWARQPNPFETARDAAPVMLEPGTRHLYSNPGIAMLSYCLTAALRDSPDKDLRSLLQHRLNDPLGIPAREATVGYGQTYPTDGLPLVSPWGGGNYGPDAIARLARLLLHRGEWEGRRLLPAALVDQVTADAGTPPLPPEPEPGPRPALGFWRAGEQWPGVPGDLICGSGAGNEIFAVIPSLDLIVVRTGRDIEPGHHWRGAVEHLLQPLLACVEPTPYPPSPVLGQIGFDPPATIRRAAQDSDNWPLTWCADGSQFAAFGDGFGFEPHVERKLSLGFARITGEPEAFVGTNVRSATGEREGGGANGAKASGLLALDGTLYAWVRNVGNSQMIWSVDGGRSWTWGFKLTESFGCPAFLNAGPDGRDQPDAFIYAASSDGASAYAACDQVVLARAPRSRLQEHDAWQVYAGERDGAPRWSSRWEERAPVFTNPGRCRRLDLVWSPAHRRCLLAIAYDDRGGWGLFDAPHPWGPWTTVFSTSDWGAGLLHGYRLPTRWLGAERAAVVYSGTGEDDALCVRGLRIWPR